MLLALSALLAGAGFGIYGPTIVLHALELGLASFPMGFGYPLLDFIADGLTLSMHYAGSQEEL